MNKEFEIMTNNILLEQGKNKKYRLALKEIKNLVEQCFQKCKYFPCLTCKNNCCDLQKIKMNVNRVLDYEQNE